MSKAARPFNPLRRLACFAVCLLAASLGAFGPALAQELKKSESGLFRDVFDQNFYGEGTRFLDLSKLYRAVFRKEVRAGDVNVFDEVPDGPFFENRQGRKRLDAEALRRGFRQTEGPDTSAPLTVIRGKFGGLAPGFFVKDARGGEYLFKFDVQDNPELATAAEVIASRFYHAIGYHVPQYDIAVFSPEQLVPAPDADIVDDSGFKKKLTKEKLEEYMLFIPRDAEGRFRASASKILDGENLGPFDFEGLNKQDSEDRIPHENRRAVRALWVFSAWLNNFDIRRSNTMVFVTEEGGKRNFRYYLYDFNAALGSGADGVKPPMITHEHLMDYGDMVKSFLALGWWEKPWQKRWREAEEESPNPPAVGYFDNRYFDPGKFDTQLPHEPFKIVTRADGFWAAKIIMGFSDEDILEIVKTGALTQPEDAEIIAKTLSARRDMIGRYWFRKANCLDEFDWSQNTLSFKDLATAYGFESREGRSYRVEVFSRMGGKAQKIKSLETRDASVPVDPAWIEADDGIDLFIRVLRPGEKKPGPFARIHLAGDGIRSVMHED